MTKIKEVRFASAVRDPRGMGTLTTFQTDDKSLRVSEDGDDIVIQALQQGQLHPEKLEVRVSKHLATFRVHYPPAAPVAKKAS